MAGPASQLICPKCYRPVQEADPSCPGCGAQKEPPGWVVDPVIGRIIDGKYRIDARLGAGGMGAVFRATQSFGSTDLGQVVIKFLLSEHVQDPDRRARFLKEARAARGVLSPHVVKVFDFGEDEEGMPFLVMELLEGQSLFLVLAQEGMLPVRRALRIAMQIAEAMVECHDKGILHRDLKPDNLLLLTSRTGDFVKIVDFGIARLPSGPPSGEQAVSMVSSLVIGTPRYMAPEQILGHPIDHRIDIFALGVIIFEMMCGTTPIALGTSDNEMNFVALNVTDPPRKVSEIVVGVPRELDALIDSMMAKDPKDRPASMAEVLVRLERLSKLPQFQTVPSEPQPAVREPAVRAVPRPSLSIPAVIPIAIPVMPPRRTVTTTLKTLSLKRRYLVPALLGAIIGLLMLVAWLLTANRTQEQKLSGRGTADEVQEPQAGTVPDGGHKGGKPATAPGTELRAPQDPPLVEPSPAGSSPPDLEEPAADAAGLSAEEAETEHPAGKPERAGGHHHHRTER